MNRDEFIKHRLDVLFCSNEDLTKEKLDKFITKLSLELNVSIMTVFVLILKYLKVDIKL